MNTHRAQPLMLLLILLLTCRVEAQEVFLRAAVWDPQSDAQSFKLIVNSNVFITTKTVVSNIAFVEGTNTLSVTASNTNGTSVPTTLRYKIESVSEDSLVMLTSTNLLDYQTANGTATNIPTSGKFRVNKKEPKRYFWWYPVRTNYVIEGVVTNL